MTNADLQALFRQPPASFVWSEAADGSRTIGTAEGCVLDLWSNRVEMTALFPPDRPDVAARSGTLMQLLLVAMRPDFLTASTWLAQQLRLAARTKAATYEALNVSRQVAFWYQRSESRGTLRVVRRGVG